VIKKKKKQSLVNKFLGVQPPRERTKRDIEIENDRLIAQIVRRNAKGICEGCCKKLQPNEGGHHHIIHRTHLDVRWEAFNGMLLCFDCHRCAHDHEDAFVATLGVQARAKYRLAIETPCRVIYSPSRGWYEEWNERLKGVLGE
jgi:hypothetical protein